MLIYVFLIILLYFKIHFLILNFIILISLINHFYLIFLNFIFL